MVGKRLGKCGFCGGTNVIVQKNGMYACYDCGSWGHVGEVALKLLEADAPRWIPCSERLPEVSDKPYAVSVSDIDEEEYELYESDPVLVCGKSKYAIGIAVSTLIYDAVDETSEWHHAYDLCDDEITDIVAWMPLPDPYKGE